jgi:hypothetical protein
LKPISRAYLNADVNNTVLIEIPKIYNFMVQDHLRGEKPCHRR